MKKPSNTKPSASSLYRLNANELTSRGFFADSNSKFLILEKSLNQITPIRLTFEKDSSSMEVRYLLKDRIASQTISITSTRPNYGGKRFWFMCPSSGCNQRVGKLYLHDGSFACRHCHNVTYRSKHVNPKVRSSDMYRRYQLASKIPTVEDRIKRDTYAGSPTKDRSRVNELRRELLKSGRITQSVAIS